MCLLRSLDMLDDDLPDLQFSTSASSGKEQCSTKQDDLPTASFASQRKACKTSRGLRKGFLSCDSAKAYKKVRAFSRAVSESAAVMLLIEMCQSKQV